MIEPILVVGIVIACTVWYMRHIWRRRRARIMAMEQPPPATGLEVLARRYARGEIDRDEYLQKKGDIVGLQVGSHSGA